MAELLLLGIEIRPPLAGLLQSDSALRVRLDASLAWSYAGLASYLAWRGERTEAAQACRTALELAPDRADVHSGVGYAYRKLGMHDEAVRCLSKAVELGPEDGANHAGLGRALYLVGRYDDAMAASLRALELDPGLADAYVNLALLHLLKRDLGKALSSYGKAVELRPKDVEYERVKVLLHLLEKRPEAFEAHYLLASYYEKKGDTAEAREHYQKYVDAAKEGEFVELAKERTRELSPK